MAEYTAVKFWRIIFPIQVLLAVGVACFTILKLSGKQLALGPIPALLPNGMPIPISTDAMAAPK